MVEARPIRTLVACAARTYWQRFPLYIIVSAIVFFADYIAATHDTANHIIFGMTDTIVSPIGATIVYVFAAADNGFAQLSLRQRWELILERSWIVIFLDLILSMVFTYAMRYSELDFSNLLLSISLLFVATMFVFSDVSAAVDPSVPWYLLLPHGLRRSMDLALSRDSASRAMIVVGLQLAFSAIQQASALVLTARHVALPDFWGAVPFGAAVATPLWIFATLLYIDALKRAKPAER